MTDRLLNDAFAHHTWATLELLDACGQLQDHQLRVGVPGVYGSILETLRHLVGSDCSYLFVTSGGHPDFDEDAAELADLQTRDGDPPGSLDRAAGPRPGS